jgi:hypothetical protein
MCNVIILYHYSITTVKNFLQSKKFNNLNNLKYKENTFIN